MLSKKRIPQFSPFPLLLAFQRVPPSDLLTIAQYYHHPSSFYLHPPFIFKPKLRQSPSSSHLNPWRTASLLFHAPFSLGNRHFFMKRGWVKTQLQVPTLITSSRPIQIYRTLPLPRTMEN